MNSQIAYDRALIRLKQMVLEQRLAILKGDTAMLCRIAALLPTAIEALQAKHIEKDSPEWKDLQEILDTQQNAASYLSSRMDDIRERLEHSANVKKACMAYGLKRKESVLNHHDLG
jgi:hypothetical protein